MTLREFLGIDLPVIQAPMAGVQGSALAIVVSNAGGLGSLPCAMLGVDAMRKELTAIRAQTTKPFNVGFFAHREPDPSFEREAARRSGCTGRNGLSVMSGGDDNEGAPRGPQKRRGPRHGGHQYLHWAARSRHRQPHHQGTGTHQSRRPGVSARDSGHRTIARKG